MGIRCTGSVLIVSLCYRYLIVSTLTTASLGCAASRAFSTALNNMVEPHHRLPHPNPTPADCFHEPRASSQPRCRLFL